MNSVLNPEAPEFHPHLTQVVQEGYVCVNKTIKTANSFPTGASYKLFQTYTDFNIVTNQISENVVQQSNQIITTESQAVKLKCSDTETNTEKIIDVNDSLLDRINLNIETVSGENKPGQGVENPVKISSWNQTPVIAKIKVGSTTFIGAKNIPRPQLNFKDPVDNSENLWVPKISDKPNNIKPLALNIIYNEKGEAVGYEHPYKVELDLYHPPVELIEPEPEPPYPPPLDQTAFTYVDTEAKLDELVKHLEGVSEIAVDVEHHSYRTYQGITCLIQITTYEGGDFIIDALAIREHIHKLNLSFTDPKKLKVFHGAENDVIWLQRDFGVYIVGLFDTHQAAKVLKLNPLSLKSLLMRYCKVNADKKYQLADWRIRPLPEELIEYARLDTHYLLYIWKQMKRELLNKYPGRLIYVFDCSRHICATTYNKQVTNDDSYMPLYVRSKKMFNTQQLAALRMLYKWRDSQARELDESTTYLLPNHMLLTLAEILPREVQGVNACCDPMPPFVKQNIITLHRIILTCRELPMEPQLYQMPTTVRTMLNATQPARVQAGRIHDLTHFPEYSDDQINLDLAHSFVDGFTPCKPDVQLFSTYNEYPHGVLSDLNVDAKLFFPPYDRYRAYRVLAQAEEAKEFKEKEARIAAISKGNELIKTEVLIKLQEAQKNIKKEQEEHQNREIIETKAFIQLQDDQNNIENENEAYIAEAYIKEEQIANVEPTEDQESTRELRKDKKATQRKRKIIEKTEQKDTLETTENKKKEFNQKINNKSDVKDSIYKNINYKKFYSETGLGPRLPKMKIKKS